MPLDVFTQDEDTVDIRRTDKLDHSHVSFFVQLIFVALLFFISVLSVGPRLSVVVCYDWSISAGGWDWALASALEVG